MKRHVFCRQDLVDVTGKSLSTIRREMNIFMPDLLKKFPTFDKNKKIIADNVFFWIAEQLEVDKETISNILSSKYKSESVSFISGLRIENQFLTKNKI